MKLSVKLHLCNRETHCRSLLLELHAASNSSSAKTVQSINQSIIARHPLTCVHSRKTHRHTANIEHIHVKCMNKTKFTKQGGKFCRTCTVSNDHRRSYPSHHDKMAAITRLETPQHRPLATCDHLAVELQTAPQSTAACGRVHAHHAKMLYLNSAGAYFCRYFNPFLQILDKFLWLQLGKFWLNLS